jgi:hypothetical protein
MSHLGQYAGKGGQLVRREPKMIAFFEGRWLYAVE